MHNANDRAEGWGMIMSAAGTMIAWGFIVLLGHDPNPGLLFGSMGVGAWKVFRNGRW